MSQLSTRRSGLVGTEAFGTDVWAKVRSEMKGRSRRYAAVSYIGRQGAELLPLRRGDHLVCDGSDAVLKSGGTSPAALRELVNRGVHVWSVGGLHAKVLANDSVAVIGSANASTHSNERLLEAVAILPTKASATRVAAFVTALASRPDAVVCDETWLVEAEKAYRPPKSGVGGRPRVGVAGVLPERVGRIFIVEVDAYTMSEEAARVAAKSTRAARVESKPQRGLRLQTFGAPAGCRSGDLLIWADGSDDEVCVLSRVLSVTPTRGRQPDVGVELVDPAASVVTLADLDRQLAVDGHGKAQYGRVHGVERRASILCAFGYKDVQFK